MNIIELAKQARFFVVDGEVYSPFNQADHELTRFLQAFAALVAAHEREACAKVCDVLAVHPEYASEITKLAAMTIRARGTI
jgi:hypothetical protein